MKGIRGLRHRGMSLVEVLVAMLVLGIGVMGYAALQLRAVKMTEDTYSRSQAMAIAQDLVERIKVNINAEATYTAAASWTGDLVEQSCFVASPDPVSRPCTDLQVAAADIYETRLTAQSMLPTGSVAVVPCASVTCVTVAWNETTTADCDESQIVDGERGANANCVVLPTIPD